jgi:glycosyltransferase involved in cell wall biosynthesis
MITFPDSLLVIPAYNCGNQINSVLKKLTEANIQVHFRTVLLIDNCSQDRTLEIAYEFYIQNQCTWLKLARNNFNYGLGGTHKSALNFCIKNNFTNFAVLHGDDQADIQDLLKHKEFIANKNDYSAFLGARFMRNSSLKGYSKFRIV